MHNKTGYFRSDIEGIRAIAILLVIGAHFAIPGFAAGFIGVDIFFVLSGFLITGVLVREYRQNQRLDLLRFYANRFRRLLPALATMLIVSSLASMQILHDTQNLGQSQAAAMAAIWLSNIYFTYADVDYFAAETNTNVFVHTWSLGVEEQFYLLWPLLILAVLALPASKNRTKPLWLALSAIAAASLLACLHLASTQPVFAFYMMPTRAWQFAAGGIVWLLSQQDITTISNARKGNFAAILLLLSAMLLIRPNTTHLELLALLPTLATCSLLWAGNCPQSSSYRLLSMPLIQQIGRLSYSWYLWHWPVLILGEHLLPIRGHLPGTLGALSLSLVLAILTHRLVENPIRFGKAKQIRPSRQIGAALALMILMNSQLLRWHIDTTAQLNSSQYTRYSRAMSDFPTFYRDGCDDWYNSDQLKPCRYGNRKATKTAVLLGDSIGAQWFPALSKLYDPDEWALVVLTKSSCPMVDEPFFYQRIGREYTECSRWRSKAIAWIIGQKPDVVFMGSTASNPFTSQQLTTGSKRILEKLSPAAGSIYLIEANPVLGFNGPGCLLKSPEKCTASVHDNKHYVQVAKLLENVTKDYANVHWLETASLVCPAGLCSAERDGVIIFRDSQHLTRSFTATAAGHFQKQITESTN